jgi:hypothetical protein
MTRDATRRLEAAGAAVSAGPGPARQLCRDDDERYAQNETGPLASHQKNRRTGPSAASGRARTMPPSIAMKLRRRISAPPVGVAEQTIVVLKSWPFYQVRYEPYINISYAMTALGPRRGAGLTQLPLLVQVGASDPAFLEPCIEPMLPGKSAGVVLWQ